MRGSILTNERWSILKNKLLEAGVYRKKNLRRTVEGILFKLNSSGCSQRRRGCYRQVSWWAHDEG